MKTNKNQKSSTSAKTHRRSSIISIFPWWAYTLVLAAVSLGLYWHTASYTYTELDDSIFIREFEQFNRQDTAYTQAFKRGVFSDSADTYYRPLLLNSYVFDRHREGRTKSILHPENQPNDSISVYHWTNIILHLLAVVLLFFVFRRLHCSDNLSFVLSLIFALHPALVQAVSWIPGRNDTLLAVFVFSFLLSALSYANGGHWLFIPLQALMLCAAVFTKETGIIAAPMALLILMILHKHRWNDKRLWILAATWLLTLLFWLMVRASASVKNQDITVGSFISGFIERLPVLLQYLGKIIIPVNLAVVPYQEQTTIWFGVAALALLVTAIWFTREKEWPLMITGFAWFFVFLLPVLVVPKSLNREIYEHRLYLPIIGILLILGHTDIIKRFSETKVLIATAILAAGLFTVSMIRTDLFSSRIVFWESAVQTAPESAYCQMMLGARYMLDKVNPRRPDGERLIRLAYSIDSTEKYVNYYMANIYWDHNQIKEAEPYLVRELQKNPQWAELYFRLARCAIERRDLTQGQKYLEKHYQLNPMDSQGINNLLMVCIDAQNYADARRHADKMLKSGVQIQKEVLDRIDQGLQQQKSAQLVPNSRP